MNKTFSYFPHHFSLFLLQLKLKNSYTKIYQIILDIKLIQNQILGKLDIYFRIVSNVVIDCEIEFATC